MSCSYLTWEYYHFHRIWVQQPQSTHLCSVWTNDGMEALTASCLFVCAHLTVRGAGGHHHSRLGWVPRLLVPATGAVRPLPCRAVLFGLSQHPYSCGYTTSLEPPPHLPAQTHTVHMYEQAWTWFIEGSGTPGHFLPTALCKKKHHRCFIMLCLRECYVLLRGFRRTSQWWKRS